MYVRTLDLLIVLLPFEVGVKGLLLQALLMKSVGMVYALKN